MSRSLAWSRCIATVLTLSMFSVSALAQRASTKVPDTLQRQITALRDALAAQQAQLAEQQRQLQAQAAEIERLRNQMQTASSVPSGPADTTAVESLQQAVNETRLASQDAPRLSITAGRPTISSPDGRSSLSLRAVVQLDTAEHQQSPDGAVNDFRRGSVGATGNRETSAAHDLSDGTYFRRARMGFEGAIARDLNYRLMLELGGSGTEGPTRINDAWIGYTGFAPFTLQVGAFSPPANMDDGTSVESSPFIERASPAELSRGLGGADGRLGLGLRGSGSRWMSAFTLTSRTVSDAEVFDSQLAAVARYGRLALTSADYNVHTGVSGTWVFQPPDQGSSASGVRYGTRFRDRPEIRVDSTRLIDTGILDADSVYAAGLEVGANWKNWYVQAENFWYGLNRPAASSLPDPSFGGYYLQGSWILTGESRRYDVANGSFQSPRPFMPFSVSSGGTGAWELALRYSHTDLNFREGLAGTPAALDSVRGGEQDIWTFGLNWYVNSNLRVLFNYLSIDVDRLNPAGPGNLTPFGPAPGTPPLGVEIGQELDIYALRTQYSF